MFLKFFFCVCVCKIDYETVHQGWTMLKNQLAKTTLLSSEHPSLLSVLQNLDHSGNQSELPLTNSWPYDKIPYRPITCYVDSLNFIWAYHTVLLNLSAATSIHKDWPTTGFCMRVLVHPKQSTLILWNCTNQHYPGRIT